MTLLMSLHLREYLNILFELRKNFLEDYKVIECNAKGVERKENLKVPSFYQV